jgi:hypothetical protein
MTYSSRVAIIQHHIPNNHLIRPRLVSSSPSQLNGREIESTTCSDVPCLCLLALEVFAYYYSGLSIDSDLQKGLRRRRAPPPACRKEKRDAFSS